jgi:hypothetical protein
MPNSAAAAPWFSCAHLTADERRLLTSYAALSDSGRRAVDAVLETLPKEHRDTPRLRIAPLAERRLFTSYAALSDSGRRAVDAVLETLPKEHRDTPRLRIAPLAALALKSVQSVAIVVSLLG